MSKKLIAVAAAAALALTGLVGIAPANAAVASTVTGHTAGTAGTAASPYTVAVPSENIITTGTSLNVNVTGITAGTEVTVTTTGSVKVLDAVTSAAAGALYNAASGKSSLTLTATTTNQVFIVYTTSTTAGTYQISTKTASSNATASAVHVKGIAGPAYTIEPTVPATVVVGTPGEVTFVVKDSLGNVIENDATVKSDLHTGSTFTPVIAGDTVTKGPAVSWDSTRKVYNLSLTVTKNTTPIAYLLTVSATNIDGLPKSSTTFLFNINGGSATSANAQVAALTAQLAASRSKATSVTKKKYNTLARKWNRAFPSQAVKLKK